MTHEEALNLILAHACPQEIDDYIGTYVIELHCNMVKVTAELVSTFEMIQYKIHDIKIGYEV